MAEGAPTNLRALEARLRNHCADTGLDFGRTRRHLSVLVVAQLVRGTGVVVKGGRNLEIRYGIDATRASSDLDAIRTTSLEEFVDDLESALEAGWAGFTGRLVLKGPVGAPVPGGYDPQRMDVKLLFRSRSFATVELEIAVEEAGGLATVDTIRSSDGIDVFEAVGLPVPDPVPLLTLPVQIAQKIHACTAPDTDGWINERAHDLIDLQLLVIDLSDEDLAAVRVACERLFRARQVHGWPPNVSARSGWRSRYEQERQTVDTGLVMQDLDAAITWANDLIVGIAAS